MSISSFRVLDVVNYNWVLAKVYSQEKLKVLLNLELSSSRSFLRTAPSSESLHGETNRVPKVRIGEAKFLC
ncbi:Uncharacterized protein HZ326_6123 [Fusarium oxysporum f. sp. albedinis]|nr:Uncharacterized protein HZ326_6123 [Fusarium oxysporum f. sp. albedinis]